MNLTLDQYIDGLERSARDLPSVLAEWDELVPELQEQYAEQLSWMLAVRPQVIDRATQEGRYVEIAQRIARATASLFNERSELQSAMYID